MTSLYANNNHTTLYDCVNCTQLLRDYLTYALKGFLNICIQRVNNDMQLQQIQN